MGVWIAPRPRFHAGFWGACTPLNCTKRSLHEIGSGGGGVIFSRLHFFRGPAGLARGAVQTSARTRAVSGLVAVILMGVGGIGGSEVRGLTGIIRP